MNLHRIADLTVDLGYKYEIMQKQAAAYRVDEECKNPDMRIYLPDEFLEEKNKALPMLSIAECEYHYTGAAFYSGLIKFHGLLLHSSAVMMEGRAYLFSADSGTGKSTHTALWQEAFGKDKAKILNDDKPAVRIGTNGIFACGTPWSGKSDLNLNEIVPLAGIGFLERSAENRIERKTGAEVVGKFLKQTVRPPEKEEMESVLQLADTILKNVPVYTLGVNMSPDAAKMAYDVMSKGQ